MRKVELSNAIVTVKDNLTWGDNEKIQSAIMAGAKMNGKALAAGDMDFDFDPSAALEAKYVTLECAVVSIKEDGKDKEFSRDWMNNLSQEDGSKLYDAVDNLSKKGERTTQS